MKAFSYLMRREFWENRGAFLIAPLSIGGFIVGSALLAISAAAILVTEVNGNEFMLSQLFGQFKDVEFDQLDKVANFVHITMFFDSVSDGNQHLEACHWLATQHVELPLKLREAMLYGGIQLMSPSTRRQDLAGKAAWPVVVSRVGAT